MRIRQIPHALLPHNVTIVSNPNSPNTFTPQESAEHVFKRVRLQLDAKLETSLVTDSVRSAQNQSQSLMFVDAVNSINVDGYDIQNNDLIKSDFGNFKVIGVKQLIAQNKLHHLEVSFE